MEIPRRSRRAPYTPHNATDNARNAPPRPRILLIEDDMSVALSLKLLLDSEGYSVGIAHTAADARDQLHVQRYDLIILDLGLPDRDGLDLLADLRHRALETPVIILSARAEEFDRVAGFRTGANDYVVKPCSGLELLERIRLQLRKTTRADRVIIRLGSAVIDLELHTVVNGERRGRLSAQEGRVLTVLWRAGGDCVTRDQLLTEAWGYKRPIPTKTVDCCIGSLRRKIELDPEHPHYLLTVRGQGYRLNRPEDSATRHE
jgi:DNA-binding response OmpR family regulator